MKKHISAVLAAFLVAISLASCGGGASEPQDTEEAVTIPAITVPTQPDHRVYTDLTAYADNLKLLFFNATAAPASDFTYETGEKGVTVTGYTGGEVVLVIPDTVEGKPVVAIAEGAFADMVSLKAVSVPDTVEAIGVGAFAGCKNLTSLRTPVYTCEGSPFFGALFGAKSYDAQGSAVPVGLSTLVLTAGEIIPDYAFYACFGLTAVSLPDTLTEIGSFAFYGCSSLAYMPVEKTALTAVGENAFTNCADLLVLELPATVETMGFAMLEGCGALERLALPFVGGERGKAETAYMGYLFGASDYTFTGGYLPVSLISVELHPGCGDIPANAFFECAVLRSVVIPEGVTAIGLRAFYGCEKLAEVILPDSVASLGDDAFHGCIRLASFSGGKGLNALGIQAFMNCVSLKTVTLPDSVTHLPNACFAGCLSLTTVTAEGVTTQGKQVFRGCERLTGWEKE